MSEIWRLNSFGLAIEWTRGTAEWSPVFVPVDTFNLKDVAPKVFDTSGRGVIDENLDSHITQEMSELSATGIIRSQTFGYLLKMALGTAGTATLVETGVYSHAFTRLNTNEHPSATMYRADGVDDQRAPFHMLESLEMNFALDNYATFSLETKGGKVEASASTPSFLTGTNDEGFLVTKATVKFASDISGLGGASASDITSVRIGINKNTKQVFVLGSTELNKNVNQQFNSDGDFEGVFEATTYQDVFTGNTKKAMQIEIEGTTLIGATEYNKITIQLAQTNLTEWDRSDGANDLIMETAQFTAEYSTADTQTMNISLQNVKSSDY